MSSDPAELVPHTPREQWEHLRRVTAVAGIAARELVVPAEGYVAGDVELHFVEWPLSASCSPTLIFLHGGGLQAHTWDAVCLALRGRARSLCLDLRGHGDSGWAPDGDYGLEALADDVERMIAVAGASGVVLVGHSLGGMASLVCAARGTAPIAGIVLVDVGPQLSSSGTSRIRDFIRSRRDFATVDELMEHVLAFAPSRRRELLATSLRHNIRRLSDGRWAWKYDPDQFEDDTRGDSSRLWRAVEGVRCPVLVVRGERSRVFGEEEARALVECLADGRGCTIQGAGHTVQGDQPLALAEAIAEFAAGLVPGRTE